MPTLSRTHNNAVSRPFPHHGLSQRAATHRHAVNRMAMTTRSRCIMRLNRSPILFIQPYLWRSNACPCAAVVSSTTVIGRATALVSAREGAQLVGADRHAAGGHQTVHMIAAHGDAALFVQVDVSSASTVKAMISKTVATYGRLDCAHNNAGRGGGDALTADYPWSKSL